MTHKLNIIFAGTPDFAAEILQYLLQHQNNNNYNISAVYTQPDRPSGRGRKLHSSAVKNIINSNQNIKNNIIKLEQPINFKKQEDIDRLAEYKPDLIIVVAYGLILPQKILDIPKYGCINIHASILPRWRGAAPIQRAILAGDHQTGITIQQMEKTLDTGPVISASYCNIENTDTTTSLTIKLCELAKPLVLNTINKIYQNKDNINNLELIKQDDNLATYAEKLLKTESNINWHNTAIEIDRQIRALNPWPSVCCNININLDNDINSNNILTFKIIEAELLSKQDLNLNNIQNIIPNIISGTILNIIKHNNNKKIIIKTNDNKQDDLLLAITKIQFSGGKIISVTDALNSKYKDYLKAGTILS